MKTFFIEVKSKVDVTNLIDKLRLPKKIGLVSSVQYLENLGDIKKHLDGKGIEAHVTGQVLGCNVTIPLKFKEKVDAYLFLGSRRFHPIEIARVTKKEVFIVNPISNDIGKVTKEEVDEIEKRKKGKILNYLHSQKIGILVTLKPGQENLALANMLKDKIKNKTAYIFVGNEINEMDLGNFNEIGAWINTACPRIEIDKVLNFSEIGSYLNED